MQKYWMAALGAAGALVAGSAGATNYVFSASGANYVSDNGLRSGIGSVFSSYATGYCGTNCNPSFVGTYDSFFQFHIGTLDGHATSAVVDLEAWSPVLEQSPSITITFYSAPVGLDPAFSDLGHGTVYGSATFTDADAGHAAPITLNADALAAIGTGNLDFAISGACTSCDFTAGSPGESIFSGPSHPIQIEVSTTPIGVPEPATWALLIGGFGLAGAAMRRRRALA